MLGYVILLVVALGAVLYLVKRSTSQSVHDSAESIQAMMTALAILVAGIWYFTERKSAAHADLALDVTGARISDDLVLVQVKVRTRNLGHILLETSDWDVRLQSVVPSYLPIDRIAASQEAWIPRIGDLNIYWDHKIQWHTLREFRGRDRRQIEPGEVDLKTFDFLVRCDTILARVSVALRKPGSGASSSLWSMFSRWWLHGSQQGVQGNGQGQGLSVDANEEWWWEDHALLPIARLCRAPVGSISHFAPTGLGEANGRGS